MELPEIIQIIPRTKKKKEYIFEKILWHALNSFKGFLLTPRDSWEFIQQIIILGVLAMLNILLDYA